MKWNIYQPPIFITLAMSLLCSCQSNVQEDNTAYERFKQKKLKEKEDTVSAVAVSNITTDEPSQSVVHKRTGVVTARADHLNTPTDDVSDQMTLAESQPSAQTPQEIHKAEVNRTFSSTEMKKKSDKSKKNIVWPKINLKKKKKDKREYSSELTANRK